MNKLLLLFAFVFSINIIGAQNAHLTFKDIPIDGNVKDFADKLSKKGFTYVKGLEGNIVRMEGKFADFNAEVWLMATPKTKIIWKIVVLTDKYTSWSSIKADFEKYKELYTKKYGKPSEDFHFFSRPYYEGDGYEMQALKLEKCTYITFFELPEGGIVIEMTKWGNISFSYEDNINVKIKRSESEQSMLNDI